MTQAMAYREGPEEQVTIKARNGSGETLKQYQPVVIFGPDGGSSEANNNLQVADFSPDNFEYTVTKFSTSYRPYWMWQRWGVLQEELANNASGRIVISGLTPIRVLYDAADAADVGGTVYQGIVPVVGQNYARHCKQGPARRLKQNTVAADADGVILDYCMLGQAANHIGMFYAGTITNSQTVTDAANTYYGLQRGYSNDRTCLTKAYSKSSGSISWNGYTTLSSDAFGVEAVDTVRVLARCSALVNWGGDGADGNHRLGVNWMLLDASDAYVSVRGINTARFVRDDITVGATTFSTYNIQSQTICSSAIYALTAGQKLFPVIYSDTGTGHTFTVTDASTEFIELQDEY